MNEIPDPTPLEASALDRRSFIRQAAWLAAAARLGLGAALPAGAEQAVVMSEGNPAAIPKAPADNCVGIQWGRTRCWMRASSARWI